MISKLSNGATVYQGEPGLDRIVIENDVASATIYNHGAHITRYQPRGAEPVLWLSKNSLFKSDKPIRGGVPICFPWFGPKADDPKAPAHGFARVSEWAIEEVSDLPGGGVRVQLAMSTNKANLHWPHEADLRMTVTVGATLDFALQVTNKSATPVTFEAALHTYLVVGDIRRTEVRGLENATYLDRLRPGERFIQDDQPICFTAETDRTYVNTESAITIIDPILKRRIVNHKTNSRSTIVWNPWIAKAKAMQDFGDDEWPGMLCIETANVADNAVTLAPGQTHTMNADIRVE